MPRYKKIEFSELRKVNVFAGFFILLFALFLSSCDFYYKNMPFAAIPPQTISGPAVIGSEWTEIIPPEPLRPIVKHNLITLGFYEENEKDFTDDSREGKILILADGRKTKVEAFLLDSNGESLELQISGRGGGIIFTRKMLVEIIDGKPKYEFVNFPTNRVYIKLKIRSEIPLVCDKIEWIGSKPK